MDLSESYLKKHYPAEAAKAMSEVYDYSQDEIAEMREDMEDSGAKIGKIEVLSTEKVKNSELSRYEDYISERQKRLEEAELNKAVEQSPNDILFGDLVKLYYQYKKSRIKDTSYYDITKKIDSKILPFYAEFKVRDITPAKVLEWQTTLEKYSYQYRKDRKSVV